MIHLKMNSWSAFMNDDVILDFGIYSLFVNCYCIGLDALSLGIVKNVGPLILLQKPICYYYRSDKRVLPRLEVPTHTGLVQ